MRNVCDMKELRRLRLLDKAIDAAARCPYTKGVASWIVSGVGNGARVAATCGSKHSIPVAGSILISYPMREPSPPIGKGGGFPDSTKPLLKSAAPLLFVHAEHAQFSTAADILAFCKRYAVEGPHAVAGGGEQPRVVIVPGVDASFVGAHGLHIADATRAAVMQVHLLSRGLEHRLTDMHPALCCCSRYADVATA
jgi:hypothetical protein